MDTIKLYDIVTSRVALPANNLEKGDTGTVVHIYENKKAFEVEFPHTNPRVIFLWKNYFKLKPKTNMTKNKPPLSKWTIENNVPVTSGPATEHYNALDSLTIEPGQKLGQCITFPMSDSAGFHAAKSSFHRNTSKRFIFRTLSKVQGRMWRLPDGTQLITRRKSKKK